MANGSQTIPTTDATMTTETLKTWLPREKLRGFGSKVSRSYASGTLWPHGEWSLGYGKERPDGGDWHEDVYVGMGVLDTPAAKERASAALPLDLSDVRNSHTRPRRGLKGITGYGAQMVKAAGYLMREIWPNHRVTMGTITLPPMSQQARREIVEAWPEIVRQLLQWQSRRLQRRELPAIIVSVSEIQPKRLTESGEAVLHLHQLWLNRPAKAGHWSFSPNVIRSFLSRLLMRLCPSYSWGFINVDTRPVDGNAAAYLAKYISKGKQQIDEALKDWGEDLCPRTWWNMTKPARDMVKSRTFKGRQTGTMLEDCLHYAWDTSDWSRYAFLMPIMVDYDNSRIIMGWRGRFTEREHAYILRAKAGELDRAC